MATVWQQLHGWVQTGENVSDAQLEVFHAAGGRGILVLLYGDDASGPWNRLHLDDLKARAARVGLWTGGWFNVFGEDPDVAADAINRLTRDNHLTLVMLDCEDAYQGANAEKLPELLRELRSRLPVGTWPIGVSPKAVDNSMIWNGRGVAPMASVYDQKVRVAPQWYSGVYLNDLGHGPEAQMRFLQTQQPTDLNFKDGDGPSGRSVPLSFVHPVVEATGVEGSDLRDELHRLEICKTLGFTVGFGVYNLENVSAPDMGLLAAQRGKLFLT